MSSLAWPFIWCKFKRIQSIICQLTFYVAALSCFYTFLLGSFLCAISRRQKEIGSKVHKRCFSFILIYNHSFVHRKVENLSGSPFVSIWRKSFCNVWQLHKYFYKRCSRSWNQFLSNTKHNTYMPFSKLSKVQNGIILIPYSSISARKWETQNCALYKSSNSANFQYYDQMRTIGGRTNRGVGV